MKKYLIKLNNKVSFYLLGVILTVCSVVLFLMGNHIRAGICALFALIDFILAYYQAEKDD